MSHALHARRLLGSIAALAVGSVILNVAGLGGAAQALLSSGERTAFVPINPCRLVDTRPGDNHVGDIAGALGLDTTVTVASQGAHGNCELPGAATGLALNVTALNQTQPTFLTLFPTGTERPVTSNLNPTPGEPPTPNAVTVDVDAAGQFSVFNRFGTVDVIVDVLGYYEDHNFDDRYYTKAAVEELVAMATAGGTPEPVTAGVGAYAAQSFYGGALGWSNGCVRSSTAEALVLPLTLPVGATVLSASLTVRDENGSGAYTAILAKAEMTPPDYYQDELQLATVNGGGESGQASFTHVLNVANPTPVGPHETYHLRLNAVSNAAALCSGTVTYLPPAG